LNQYYVLRVPHVMVLFPSKESWRKVKSLR